MTSQLNSDLFTVCVYDWLRWCIIFQALMPLVLKELASPEATNRRNAAFCAGELCKNGGDSALKYFSYWTNFYLFIFRFLSTCGASFSLARIYFFSNGMLLTFVCLYVASPIPTCQILCWCITLSLPIVWGIWARWCSEGQCCWSSGKNDYGSTGCCPSESG